MLGVAVVGPQDAVPPVAAHVQEGVELAVVVAGEDDGVFADVGVEVVVEVGDEGDVADHLPRASEDLLQLVLVDLLVDEDAPVELARRLGSSTWYFFVATMTATP